MISMKNFQILLLLGILLVAWSCDTVDPPLEDTGTLSIDFAATFDGEALVGGTEYTLPDGKKAKFSQFNFFIADASVNQVEQGVSNIVDLSDVEFVELTQTASSPLENNDHIFSFYNLATGSYTGLDFTLGLGDVMNGKTPSDQDLGDNSPLRRSSHHWSAWNSYIFMKLEGQIDFNDDGVLDDNETIVYHTGSENDGIGTDTPADMPVNLPLDFDIEFEQTTNINLNLDIRDMLYNAAGEQNWDIANRPTTHNPDDFSLVLEIMEKAADAIKVIE